MKRYDQEASLILAHHADLIPSDATTEAYQESYLRWHNHDYHVKGIFDYDRRSCNANLYVAALLTLWKNKASRSNEVGIYALPKQTSMNFKKCQQNFFKLYKNNPLII